jgi:hypothetical protein
MLLQESLRFGLCWPNSNGTVDFAKSALLTVATKSRREIGQPHDLAIATAAGSASEIVRRCFSLSSRGAATSPMMATAEIAAAR